MSSWDCTLRLDFDDRVRVEKRDCRCLFSRCKQIQNLENWTVVDGGKLVVVNPKFYDQLTTAQVPHIADSDSALVDLKGVPLDPSLENIQTIF